MSDFKLGMAAQQMPMTWAEAAPAVTVYDLLAQTADQFGDQLGLSFQLLSDPKAPAESLTWRETHARVTATANMLRDLGVGEGDVIAYMLPNCNETVLTLLGGATAGIVNPINPLLEAEQIAGILRETKAKVLVTLKAFPKTDLAQKAAEAVADAPCVETVVEVDLNRYLTGVKSWIVPMMRPKTPVTHHARVVDFHQMMMAAPRDALTFDAPKDDRIAAMFHTGGTTGTPKVAQHTYSGMIYNGWICREILFAPDDVVFCPLPLFHVFAAYPMLMGAVASGAHFVMPTPGGYRGDGVFDNFWKLIERWGVTFMFTVPTAVAALMQRPVDADISSLRHAISGSAALPMELYRRFLEVADVEILEGYGMTEATCLISCNPIEGETKVGSVGLTMPYTHVRILDCAEDGTVKREMGVNETGEICISSPGVIAGGTFLEADKNLGLFADEVYLRSGDLGRIDAQGYVWISGRSKDLIIRGGHNIDPAMIEEALAAHPAVAMVGAIGQPDAVAGELPCAYVELLDGAQASEAQLLEFARLHITERAAIPKYLEIVAELPKTAVGKVFKPELRKSAIKRVYDAALVDVGADVTVSEVRDDKMRGLVAVLQKNSESVDEEKVLHCLDRFTRPWEWGGDSRG